jgi:MFS family permease
MMVESASSNTLIQSMVPDALRGRVMAVYAMMFMGMGPLGALLAGAMADRIGAPMTVAGGGIIALVCGSIFALRLPALRPEARELIIAQQARGGEPVESS